MRARLKQLVKLLFQGGVSAALIFWLLCDSDLRQQLRPALAYANWVWVSAAFLIYGCVEFLGAIRWQFLLRSFGFHLSWWDATRILLIGIFFNTLLPGLIAGDALRAIYLSRRFPQQTKEAVLVVFIERLFGLMGLIVVGVSMMLLRYHWLHLTPMTGYLTDLALVIVGAGALGLCVSFLVRRQDSSRHSYSGPMFPLALGTTVAAHLCYAGSFYCSGAAFASYGPTASFLDMLTLTPIVNTFTSLPISFAGVGVRESLFQVLLNDLCGVPGSAAVLIGSLGFAIRAVWAILGCLWLAACHRLQWHEWTDQIFRHRVAPGGEVTNRMILALCRQPVSMRRDLR